MATRIEQVTSTPLDKQLVVMIAIVIFTAGVELVGLFKPLRSGLERMARPVSSVAQTIVTVVTVPYRVAAESFHSYQRIQDLELKYQELSAQLTELTALREENQALREMLENTDRQLITSTIAAPINSYGIPYVAKGSQDGISEGQLVFVAGAAIGKVFKTSAYQSEVILFSHPNSIPILVATQREVSGVAVGTGRHLLLTEIPADASIEIGDRVFTTGQEGVARDLYLGEVRRVNHQPAEPTKTAVIEPPVDFYQARVVEIRR